MKTGTISQAIHFEAPAEKLYEMLMDERLHAAFTGAHVLMSREPEGKFTVFDGYCRGHNIVLVPGKKIVQAWHFAEDGWPDDHYSLCTFEFVPDETGTMLHFTQLDIPLHKVKDLETGWYEYYWNPMKEALSP